MKERNVSEADEALCAEVEREFRELQEARKSLERGWELNLNFVNGEQYCRVLRTGEMVHPEKTYEWEQRRVFNHVAPVVDIRLAKLSRIRPALSVRAASSAEEDIKAAELARAILSAAHEDCDIDEVMNTATTWSEICGTAFYKICWSAGSGMRLGETENGEVREGGVRVEAVPPFEIYPYSLTEERLEDQIGIIHAKAVPADTVRDAWGLELKGGGISEFNRFAVGQNVDTCCDYVLVIERYLRPTSDRPNGRLTVVAGEKLLYDGDLPYVNGTDGKRSYPFVKQTALKRAGSFFGTSVVDRLIPLQRAYNAVKNRKHEYLNRISMGTVAVEEGSVDVDELAEDGLAPGKVIVYRQGGTPPSMLTLGNVPEEFWKEEESLLTEFSRISGTGDLSDNADSYAGVTSATGLQLIIEQDDDRLNVAYTSLKRALKAVGRHILRLYRQFATDVRLLKYAGADGVRALLCFKGSDISNDDVVLDADTDLNMTTAQRRTVVYELLEHGLFADGEGRTPREVKKKILEFLGYASLADVLSEEAKEE